MDQQEFKTFVPTVTYTVKDNQVTILVDPIDFADGYEVYISDTQKGKYKFLTSGTYHILSHYLLDNISRYYKVHAFKDVGDERIFSEYSIPQCVDLFSYAQERDKKIESFFGSIRDVSHLLTNEDLDIAIDSLKLAGLEIKEHEERKRLEENAERARREIDLKNKRRQLRAERELAKKKKREIERIDHITSMELPTDYENSYSNEIVDKADSTFDALLMCLDSLGMVDIEFIAALTGEDLKTVISNLKGSIYQNPLHWNEIFYKGWETADEYLSGNLMHKYQVAKKANEKYNGYFQNNITALEGILEPEVQAEEIYVTLGSPWLPTDIIDDFIAYMAFGNDTTSSEAEEYYQVCSSYDYAVRHDEYTGFWEIPNKPRFRTSRFHGMFEEVNFHTYGTDRIDMLHILEATLNMKTITITDMVDDKSKKRMVNQQETIKALEKQRYIIEVFQKWIYQDENRKKRIQSAYSRKYGNFRTRHFDGRYLELPGLNKDIKLYPYQKDAVARILSSPNTLLAHDVGAGKTYIMICAGMELRRLKKSKKNLYVIPNNIISQWNSLFKKLYPEANLLVVSNKNFTPKKRAETLNKIKTEDYDAILMTYSCFDMLSPSKKFYMDLYQERKDLLEKAAENFHSAASIERKIKKINDTLDKIQQTYKDNALLIPFDELGINTLFVDEAHNYKNIDLESKITRVRGLENAGSKKANDMLDKVDSIQRDNNGGRIIFATGTPITNSISDIFVMQKYLQDGELFYQNVHTFDAWIGMYAEKTTDFEIDVDTNSYHLVTRFSKYKNVPELAATLSSIADFHQNDKSANLPELNGYTNTMCEGSENFKSFLRDISLRADDIHKKRVTTKEDNMLKLTTDGRKAALDMRLIDTAFGLDEDAKVVRCASNIIDVYNDNTNLTQLVFCDSSTPKGSFNLYDELKKLLIAMGMPKERIAFVHDATSDDQRHKLFQKMNNGELSVLIGSTAKMGHGMNVQKHLVAIHHLDVPWRPSDMVQREGRILRQGNKNKEVKIFRYITRASFDAYSWQLLETKQRFISQIMTGKVDYRETGELDDMVLNYGEVKALAVGNPLIKRRVETLNELSRLSILQRDFISNKQRNQQLVNTLPLKIEDQKERIARCQADIEAYQKEKVDYKEIPYLEQKEIRSRIYQAVKEHQNSPEEVEILTYQGFKVVVPAYMIPRIVSNKEKGGEDGVNTQSTPYIHLVKNNVYYLEIESESGITARLNNFLEALPKVKESYEEKLKHLETRLSLAKQELASEDEGYIKDIEKVKKELNELNRKLGMV